MTNRIKSLHLKVKIELILQIISKKISKFLG